MIAKNVVCGLDKAYFEGFKKLKILTAHGLPVFQGILILAIVRFKFMPFPRKWDDF